MATGGTPLARVFLILVAFAIPATAQDSEAKAKLSQGLELLRAGDSDSVKKAIGTLREALALNPSSEDAISALGQAEERALINLIASGQEGANIAKAIMDIAMPNLPDKAFNEAEMKELVKTAVTSDDYSSRFNASMGLARVYGEYAVPHLIAYLGSSNTEYKINAHICLMNRIGRDAVLPLNEALQHENAQVRLMVASELGVIGDERSLAALAEAAQTDQDANARSKAEQAFQRLTQRFDWASGMSASDLYLRLANLYYAGDYRVLAFADRPLAVWMHHDGLKYQATPRHLYLLKLAEEACYDALRLDANNAGAAALLARVIASERISSDAMANINDDDLTKTFADGLANAHGLVAAMGWDTLSQALSDALEQDDAGAAAFILGVMPQVYGGSDFTFDSPVVRATTHPSATVRLAAAEAVLRFNGIRRVSAFPDPDAFINLVAQSAGEIIPRNILVVDSNDARRNKMLTDLNSAGYIAYDARTGSDGLVRALRYAGLDLVILSSDLGDMETLAVINNMSESEATKNTPVMVVGTTEQASDDAWRNLYKDRVAGMVGVPDGPGLPTEDFRSTVSGSFGGEAPGASARYARSASILAALAHTDTSNALFNWGALTDTLVGLLTADVPDDPPVRLNAVHALANLGDSAALGALVALFGNSDDAGHQAAAANAVAAICRANGVGLETGDFDMLMKGTGSDDANVRAAAFAALGAAQLTAEQTAAVATANRPGMGGSNP